MEQHPIPRQITTFEFKLIGFMTLKQFLYLVVSFPLAYIVFIIFPIPLINFLLGLLVAVGGVVMAFVPIRDRSIDIWIKNLWKRLQNPTQYYYQKKNEPLYFLRDLYFLADPHHMIAHIESKEKLAEYLSRTRQRPRPNYRKKQIGTLLSESTDSLKKEPQIAAAAGAGPAEGVTMSASSGAPVDQTGKPAQGVPTEFPAVPPVIAQSQQAVVPQIIPPGAPIPAAPVLQAAPVVQTIIPPTGVQPPSTVPYVQSVNVPQPVVPVTPVQPEPVVEPPVAAEPARPPQPRMVTEIEEDTPTLTPQIIPPVPPPEAADIPVQPQNAPVVVAPPQVVPQPVIQPQVIPPQAPVQQVVSPVPTQPASQTKPSSAKQQAKPFFMGVIYNSKKIPLPGVLVYVKGQDGAPLRLMKTNPHGVFATYSPIPPGTYPFEIKDPNGTYFFDTMNLQINESNPAPFEFRSKEIL